MYMYPVPGTSSTIVLLIPDLLVPGTSDTAAARSRFMIHDTRVEGNRNS